MAMTEQERVARALDPWAWGEFNANEAEAKVRVELSLRNANLAISAYKAHLAEAGLVVVEREPTEEMRTHGARSIGHTMRMTNHLQRAEHCWQAMIALNEINKPI